MMLASICCLLLQKIDFDRSSSVESAIQRLICSNDLILRFCFLDFQTFKLIKCCGNILFIWLCKFVFRKRDYRISSFF